MSNGSVCLKCATKLKPVPKSDKALFSLTRKAFHHYNKKNIECGKTNHAAGTTKAGQQCKLCLNNGAEIYYFLHRIIEN